MNIHRALADVAAIRLQLDRAANYRGFRSTATGLSSVIVVVGAIVQTYWVPQPDLPFNSFLFVWLGVACISSLVAGSEMVIRGMRTGSRLVWRTHRNLVQNLLPSMLVGCMLTVVIANHALSQTTNNLLKLLPGIWAMIFGLGLLNCRADFPAKASGVAAFYILGGMVCLSLINPALDHSGFQMVGLFGIGQALLGWVLYWNFESPERAGHIDG